MTKTREQAAIKIDSLLEHGTCYTGKSGAYHFGKMELRELMDYIYGEAPKRYEDNILSAEKRALYAENKTTIDSVEAAIKSANLGHRIDEEALLTYVTNELLKKIKD